MDINKYIDLLKNTIKYDLPGHNLQKIINKLVESKFAAYIEEDKNENPDLVSISTDLSRQDRIIKCLDECPENTISIIEQMFIEKGYRYSIYYKCDEFIINDKGLEYNNLRDYNPICASCNIIDYSKPIETEIKNKIIIKFSKYIREYIPSIDASKNIIYPTVWIYHKDLKILEYRFDNIAFKNDDDFYKTTLKGQLQQLKQNYKFDLSEFRTNKLIEKMIEEKKTEVNLIVQDIGLKGNSSAKLKVGINKVMPFIGDLEELIEKNYEVLYRDKESEKIANIFINYISEVKREAKYKSRLISIKSKEKNKIVNVDINMFFSYRNENYDLYNFLEAKKINMEMMNNAIEYIFKFYTDNKNNK